MTTVKFPDAAGETLTLMDYGGETYMNWFFTEQSVRDAHRIPVRDDDIFFCSYPKSGVHWIWEMARMICEGTTNIDHGDKENMMLENLTMEKAAALPSPRFMNSHMYLSQFPEGMDKHKNKIVFLYRNPKDVAVSFYKMHTSLPHYEYKGKFNNYLPLFFSGQVDWGSYFTYMQRWDKDIKDRPSHPIHVMAYEAMQKTPIEELRRLSKFLDRDHDDEFLEKVNQACDIKAIREKKKIHSSFGESHATTMYRKGIIGDWENYFSVARNEQMDQLIKEQTADLQFHIQCE